jgi:2-iminobutanoate/2-iminopropanoate deaminase
MKKEILTSSAPAPIGPYSQAIDTGSMVFCSGQIPLDPSTGAVVGEGDVEAQTRQVMRNISEVLKQAGLGFQQVIKTTIFLKNMTDFPKVNAVYAESFQAPYPARSTVEVARLPKDVAVEIEVIALRS